VTDRAHWTDDALLLRLVDWGFGLSALGWAVRMVLVHGGSPVGLSLAGLNATAGILFLARQGALHHGRLRDALLCLGSLAVSGIALKLAPAPGDWPIAAAALFAVAGAGAIASLASLGRSFGVLPAVRSVVERGPYRWVRHPAYACELLMVGAAAWAARSALAALVAAVAAALVVLRVLAEERVLDTAEDYALYRRLVPWRLVPRVW
jgi:protein-S-isoprenylcysteine O-methyltransferase Ste14